VVATPRPEPLTLTFRSDSDDPESRGSRGDSNGGELAEVIKAGGRRAYVGFEPSGSVHIGHLLTINKLMELQKLGFHIIVLLAGLHAYLNEKGSFEEIREKRGDKKYEKYEDMKLDYKNGRLYPLDIKMNAVRYSEGIMKGISSFSH